MEFTDLKCDYSLYKNFYVVAKCGSFSKAANILFLTQPTISYSVKKLESLLGFKLIYRNIKEVKLTPEGETLYKYIATAHNVLIDGERAMENLSFANRGVISIGVPISYDKFDVLNAIKEFKRKNPQIIIKLFVRSTKELLDMLDCYKLDLMFGFSNTFNNNKDKYNVNDFSAAQLCFAATPQVINGGDIKKIDYILPNSHSTIATHLQNYFKDINFTPNVSIESFLQENILEFVKDGLGIGAFYKKEIDTYLNDGTLSLVDLNKPIPTIGRCFAFKDNYINYTTKTFVDYLKDRLS